MPDPVVAPATPAAPQAPANPTSAAEPTPTPQAPAVQPQVTEPVEFMTKEDIEALKTTIAKEGDEYVWKSPDTTTVYKGKTAGEVIQQMLKGVAEKDRLIEANKTRVTRPTLPNRPGQPTPPGQPQALPVDDMPKPPDERQIQSDVYNRLLSDKQFDPKYLKFTTDDWKNLELELGAVQASAIFADRKEFLRAYEDGVKSQMSVANTTYANDLLGSEAVDTIIEELEGEKIVLDQSTFDSLLDKAYLQDNAWTAGGRLKPAQVTLNFMKHLRALKASAPPSPLRTALTPDPTAPKNLPPGVVSPPPGPTPLTPPASAPAKSLDEAFRNIGATLPKPA